MTKEFWLKLLEVLEKWLPPAIAAFLIGKRVGESGKDKAELELKKMKLILEKVENEQKVISKNSGKSDLDIVRDTIRECSDIESREDN